jgi:hypothetical protein
MEVRLAHGLYLDAGYRYRAVDGPTSALHEVDMPTDKSTRDLGNLSASVFSLGLSWSF